MQKLDQGPQAAQCDAQLMDEVRRNRVRVIDRQRRCGVGLPLAYAGEGEAAKGFDHVLPGFERRWLGACGFERCAEEQAVAAFRLGNVGRHQRQGLCKFAGEGEEIGRLSLFQLELQLADRRLSRDAVGRGHAHLALVDHQQDADVFARAQATRFTAKAGGEYRHQGVGMAREQFGGLRHVHLREIETARVGLLPFGALRQAAARHRGALHRLQPDASLAAGAQRDLARLELEFGCVVIRVVEGDGIAELLGAGQQGMAAQRRQRGSWQCELQLDFVAHDAFPRAGDSMEGGLILVARFRRVMHGLMTARGRRSHSSNTCPHKAMTGRRAVSASSSGTREGRSFRRCRCCRRRSSR